MNNAFFVLNAIIMLFLSIAWSTSGLVNTALKTMFISLFLMNLYVILNVSGYVVGPR